MINSILNILSFKAFIARSDDPLTHFSKKVGGEEFVLAIVGHQHIKWAKARLKNKKLHLGKPTTAFCENFQKAEMDAPWVAEMITEAAGTKHLLLGLNILFANLKVYPAEQKLKEIGYNSPQEVAHDSGNYLEMLQKLRPKAPKVG